MVVDVIENMSSKFTFKGDYAEVSLSDKAIRKLYFVLADIEDDDSKLMKLSGWVSKKQVFYQEVFSTEFYELSVKELTAAILIFFENQSDFLEEDFEQETKTWVTYTSSQLENNGQQNYS